jgi:hypothetical protein
MAPRKIRVRRKGTDDIAVISERAFKHFAGYYERLDEPESRQPADKPAALPTRTATSKRQGAASAVSRHIYVNPRRVRHCRICMRESLRRSRARRRLIKQGSE